MSFLGRLEKSFQLKIEPLTSPESGIQKIVFYISSFASFFTFSFSRCGWSRNQTRHLNKA